mgnify:FL=1
MTPTRHLAEFNLGVLRHDWDDPRVKDFADNIDRVNALAIGAPGFVWMLGEDDMHAAQTDPAGALGGSPRTASTLSVWESADALERFVWTTVHKHFYDRRAEWYAPTDVLRLVMWWVPVGHRPTVGEAMERFRHLEAHGDGDLAFGWAGLAGAGLWKTQGCKHEAAA